MKVYPVRGGTENDSGIKKRFNKIQKTSNECGQSAATCPCPSQSTQNKSDGSPFVFLTTFCSRAGGVSSRKRSQVKMSCPGLSQISQTSSLELRLMFGVDERLRGGKSVGSRQFFDDFLLFRDNFSLRRSSSCSSSSCKNLDKYDSVPMSCGVKLTSR